MQQDLRRKTRVHEVRAEHVDLRRSGPHGVPAACCGRWLAHPLGGRSVTGDVLDLQARINQLTQHLEQLHVECLVRQCSILVVLAVQPLDHTLNGGLGIGLEESHQVFITDSLRLAQWAERTDLGRSWLGVRFNIQFYDGQLTGQGIAQ